MEKGYYMNESINNTYHTLRNEMAAEIKLFCDLNIKIEGVKKAVQKKEWENLEKKLGEIGLVSSHIENIEDVRDKAFSHLKEQLNLDRTGSLTKVLPHLSFEKREVLKGLQEELKGQVIKTKIEYQNLRYYLKNISGFIYQFLEELFPHTKGKIYSRTGRVAATAPESVVINREL